MSAVMSRQVTERAATESTSAMVARWTWVALRLALAFEFLWAFFDKTFGWGKATPAENAWIEGGSPTTGYLSGVEGPFGDFYNGLAGNAFVDWLFMLGLLGIGLALALGIGMRIAAATSALLLVMMWTASLPIPVNPFLDDHLIEALVLIGLAAVHAGDTLGLGRRWAQLPIVQRFPILR